MTHNRNIKTRVWLLGQLRRGTGAKSLLLPSQRSQTIVRIRQWSSNISLCGDLRIS